MLYRCVLCDAVAPRSGGRLPESDYCPHEFAPVTEPTHEKETDAPQGNADDDDQEDTALYQETGEPVG